MKQQAVPCPSAWGCKEMGRRGNQSGRLFPRPKTAAMNVFIVAARKDAEDAPHAREPTSIALVCATVEETVTSTIHFQVCSSK